ncbi:uncharacterized protein N7482_004061 [Penicillium canariense]|uniref:Uncharacterized protein n=1 Tax=Penicillium canariense TaxID=189055 RepID=A0A9W9IBN6_9EURO|nr:uncharacterized protein N7482_004061 [Penicillium canariense]KAJ5168467.1 hypothetical protein N7482_004061 [Penicillium canariense]
MVTMTPATIPDKHFKAQASLNAIVSLLSQGQKDRLLFLRSNPHFSTASLAKNAADPAENARRAGLARALGGFDYGTALRSTVIVKELWKLIAQASGHHVRPLPKAVESVVSAPKLPNLPKPSPLLPPSPGCPVLALLGDQSVILEFGSGAARTSGTGGRSRFPPMQKRADVSSVSDSFRAHQGQLVGMSHGQGTLHSGQHKYRTLVDHLIGHGSVLYDVSDLPIHLLAKGRRD